MDPLSMTASIIAILELTTMLTGYIYNVRQATREQQKVAVEASNLFGLLTSLRFRVEEARSSEPWFNQVKLLGLRNGPLDQFKHMLEKMVERISSTRKRDQVQAVLAWKFTKSEIDDALTRIERLKSLIQCALTEDVFALSQTIHSNLKMLEKQTAQLQIHANQDLQDRLAQWLGIPDPSTNYHAALKKRHPETGLWLVNGTQFNDWRSLESSLMWLHGNAGCGKTVLSAAVLQSIIENKESRSDMAVSYFYFDFNDVQKQSSGKAIRSLLFQLAQQVPNGLQGVEYLFQECDTGQQQPEDSAVQLLLQKVIDRMRSKYIILDGLDECTDREDLLRFVCDLVHLNLKGLHIMVTSRREKDIEEQLRPIVSHNVSIQSAAVDVDIQLYVRDRLAIDPKLTKWSESVRDEIINMIMKKANGMFQWVHCQLESIRQCVKVRALRKVLLSLPKTLYGMYDRILQDLESRGQLRDAITALRWLCYSNRPLQLSEMVEGLAIENGDDGGFFPEERLPDPLDLLVVCSSLVNIYTASNDSYYSLIEGGRNTEVQVQLAHSSVKEYLMSNRSSFQLDFKASSCHRELAEGCLHYLLHLANEAPLHNGVMRDYPLSCYAAEYWWQHLQRIDGTFDSATVDLVIDLLAEENDALISWVQIYDIDRPRIRFAFGRNKSDVAGPLYYAASIGVPEVAEKMLKRAVDVNRLGGVHGTALQAASVHGHKEIVQMLIDAGAYVNAQGGEFGNALQAASGFGREIVLQMLIDAGANVNAQEDIYGNALQTASGSGHEKVVQTLINAGANVNNQGGILGNALCAASLVGSEKVVQMLLDAGSDVNAQGGRDGDALQAASKGGHKKVVQMLLDAGAAHNESS